MLNRLVGTGAGQALLTLRGWTELRALSYANPEKAAMVANGVIADRLIARLCPGGGVFVDVGAHVGSVFSTVHHHDKSIRILAVEADPDKVVSLRQRFSYCELHECAVGESPGETTFYMNPAKTGYNSLAVSDATGLVERQVQVRRLDDLFDGVRVDVMKMDIEGAELGALRGAAALIARAAPVIMFESAGLAVNSLGYSAAALWEWLAGAGYQICTPDRLAHDAPPLSQDAFLDAHHYPMRTHNFFAVPPEQRTRVRDRARAILGVDAGGP